MNTNPCVDFHSSSEQDLFDSYQLTFWLFKTFIKIL